jgi:hypothetical protein
MRNDTNARKNLRLGLILGGISLVMFFVMLLWAWQYVSLIP